MPRSDDFYGLERTRPSGGRVVIAVVLLLVICGLTAAAWTFIHWKNKAGETPVQTATSPAATDTQPLPGNEAAAATPTALNAQMADLEQRMIRTSVAAQSASAYANRAEAIMVAFAARRALDAGQPLDYLEGQLRLLFGEAQPKAVNTIINAAADPVTSAKLRAGLEDIGQLGDKGNPREGWWSATTRTLGSLVELRSADAPAPEPDQRLIRARRAVEGGQIDDAIKEVAALPKQPAISQWLEQARRYNEAHRALDVIEQAAILEPRNAPLVAPAGGVAGAKPDATPAETQPETKNPVTK